MIISWQGYETSPSALVFTNPGFAGSGTGGTKAYIAGHIDTPLLLSDNFASYAEYSTLGGQGNWLACLNTVRCYSPGSDRGVTPYTVTSHVAVGRSETFSNDQYAQVTIVSLLSTVGIGAAVRVQGSGATATYYVYYVRGNARHLYKVINGSSTEIATVATGANAGDIVKLEVSGSTLRCYLNGALDTGLTGGTGVFTDTDILGGGSAGIGGYGVSYSTVADNWVGGNIAGAGATVSGILKGKGELIGASGFPIAFVRQEVTGLYEYEEGITLNGSDVVTWASRIGSGNALDTVNVLDRPVLTNEGIYFDATNHLLGTGDLGLIQPETFFLVVRQTSWTHNNIILSARPTWTNGYIEQYTPTPGIEASAGSSSGRNGNLALGTFGIVRLIFNGASSKLQVDETTARTGNFGALNMAGFVIGGRPNGNNAFGGTYKAVAVYNGVYATADEQDIYDYFERKYFSVRGTLKGKAELLSVILGSEEVTNGSFASDIGWTKGSGWTIDGGVAIATATNASISQNTLVVGLIYRTRYDVSSITAGGVRVIVGDNLGTTRTVVGTYIQTLLASSNIIFELDGTLSFSGTVDNVIVKEVTGYQTNGVAAVSGTLKGKGSLLSHTLGTEVITDGDFHDGDNWLLDTEVTISGGTANYDNTGTSYARQTQTAGEIVLGNYYRVLFTTSVGSGRLAIGDNVGGNFSLPATIFSAAKHGFVGQAERSTTWFYIWFYTNAVFSIDDVSLRQVTNMPTGVASVSGTLLAKGKLLGHTCGSELLLNNTLDSSANWTISDPSTITISDGVAHFVAAEGPDRISQALKYTVGNFYWYSFEIKNWVSGSVFFCDAVINWSGTKNANGVYSGIHIASGTSAAVMAGAAGDLDVDNVYTHEITFTLCGVATVSGTLTAKGSLLSISNTSIITDGTFSVGGTFPNYGAWYANAAWTIANGIATYDDTVNSVLMQHPIATPFIASTKYVLRFDLIIGTGETAWFYMDYNGQDMYIYPAVSATNSGTKVFPFVSEESLVNSDGLMLNARTTSSTAWSMDNFSIRQLANCPSGVATVSGTLLAKGKLYGTSDGVTALTADLNGRGRLRGSIGNVLLLTDDFQAYSVAKLGGQGNWLSGVEDDIYIYDNSGDRVFRAGLINVNSFVYYNSVVHDNQFSQITIDLVSSSSHRVGVIVRAQYTGPSDYRYLKFNVAVNTVSCSYIINGTNYSLGYGSTTISSGDTIRLEAKGNYLYCYHNEELETALGSGGIFTIPDGFESGAIGLNTWDTGTSVLGDEWIGGNIADFCGTTITGSLQAKGTLTGAISSSTSVSGLLIGRAGLVGSTGGVASVSGTLYNSTPSASAQGQTNGITVLTGVLKGKGKLYGTTSGVTSLTGVLKSRYIVGASNGVSTIAGVLKAKGRLTGAISSSATVSGLLSGQGRLVSQAGGVASVSATLRGKGRLAGATNGSVLDSGTATGLGALFTITYGVASASATLRAKGRLYGSTAGVANLTADLNAEGVSLAQTAGVSIVSATLIAKGRLVGRTDGTSSTMIVAGGSYPAYGATTGVAVVSGTLKGKGRLYGSTAGVTDIVSLLEEAEYTEYVAGTTAGISTVSTTLLAKGRLYGTTNGGSAISATLPAKGRLVGITNGAALLIADLNAEQGVFAHTDGVSVVSGVLYGTGVLQGLSSGVSETTNEVGGRGDLVGAILSYATLEAILVGTGRLTGQTDGITDIEGIAWGVPEGQTSGNTDGTTNVAGLLQGKGRLQGAASGIALVIGIRAIPWLYEKIEKNSYITGVISLNSYITMLVLMNSHITSTFSQNSYITTSALMTSIIREEIVMNSIIKDDDE